MNKVLIFGREPVVIVNAIEGTLVALLAFGALSGLGVDSPETVAIIMAVVSAALNLYVAYFTRDTLLAAALGFVKAAAPLLAVYGYGATDAQLAGVMGAITVLFGLWHRTQTGPAVVPSFALSQYSMVPTQLVGEAQDSVASTQAGAVVEVPTATGADPALPPLPPAA